MCDVYAFYLPQYHPTPENSQWWGEGFTEWSNVTRARPLFNGHYQPRHPGALGFYDLRVPQVMAQQVDLAKRAGISGFVFYYYWFSGKTMLDMPLRQLMARWDELQMPFFVMWCNDNWKRSWLDENAARQEDLLLEHQHLPDDPERFIDGLADALRHPGYVRIDGKALLLVYPMILRTGAYSDAIQASQAIARWREQARKLGLGELLIGALEHPYKDKEGNSLDTQRLGVDFFFEFPPNHVFRSSIPQRTDEYAFYRKDSQVHVVHYEDLATFSSQLPPPSWPLVKTVIAGSWDNTARMGDKAHVYHGATPARYERWLADAMRFAIQRPAIPKHPMVFVNAWNEWAEGAYLEPDKRFGYGYLAATQRAITGQSIEAATTPTTR